MASHSPAAGTLPGLAIPNGFGVNIHFTGDRPDLDLIRDGDFRVIRAAEGTLVDMPGQSRPVSWQSDQLKLAVSGSPQYLLLAD